LCETFVFEQPDLLGLDYVQCSDVTLTHPTIEKWAGSPDGMKGKEPLKTVFDLKCPMTLKSFCQLVQPIYDGLDGMDAMNKIRATHKDGEKYFWQLVSNAILTNSKFAELIVYCPYLKELELIRDCARNVQDASSPVYWIANSLDEELPYLIEDKYYKNINIIRFEVSQEDKEALTERVKLAAELLIKL